MSIMRNLDKVHVAVVLDNFRGRQFGSNLKAAAVAALSRGVGSDEWREYMKFFADNEEQLTRLSVESPDDADYIRESRAYIVANAICGAASTGQTGLNVDARIEVANTNPDGTIAPPFPIPDIPA